ncbi:hypothetical protein [Kitasatospora sp. NPDC101183]|uniref:hypothetical protein n=1 Tax=Kitasatospora sp. NPDC101183 TaxID=3364100 RepID=UPI003811A7FE
MKQYRTPSPAGATCSAGVSVPTTAPSTGETRLVCGAAGAAARADPRAPNRGCSPVAKGAKSASGCFASACGFRSAADGTDRIGRSRGTVLDAEDARADADGMPAAWTVEATNTVATANTIHRNHDRADNRAVPAPPDKAPPTPSTSAGTRDTAGRGSTPFHSWVEGMGED